MSSPLSIVSSEKLSEPQRIALLSLLSDDDPGIYQAVRDKILSFGPETGEWLRPHVLSDDPILRRRSREILRHFDKQETDTWFLAFCLKNGEEFDLEEGAWLLGQTEYPDINIEAYRAVLDNYAAEVRERIDVDAGPAQVLTGLNKYLFEELGFAGNEKSYYDPDNSYLNRVVDRRLGNPINLCLLYMLLARRLQVPIAGIGLPGHFICRCQSASKEIFVDVFNKGRFLTKADCVQYLLRGNHSLREDFLAPLTPRRMLMRICSNLHQIYVQLESPEETTRLQRYVIALTR